MFNIKTLATVKWFYSNQTYSANYKYYTGCFEGELNKTFAVLLKHLDITDQSNVKLKVFNSDVDKTKRLFLMENNYKVGVCQCLT